jgi:hypothetical protein
MSPSGSSAECVYLETCPAVEWDAVEARLFDVDLLIATVSQPFHMENSRMTPKHSDSDNENNSVALKHLE